MQGVPVLAFEFTLPVISLGLITGLIYGILSVGLVLVYRSNRIINFAHGEIGATAATLLGVSVVRWHVPYWVAFPLALLLAAGLGAGAEIAVIRRLRKAPKLMSIVGTLGVAQFLLLMTLVINNQARFGSAYPQPPGFPTFHIGPLLITRAYSGMLFLAPAIVIALAVFLRRSRYGIAIRAAAANPDAGRLTGISSGRMSSLAWALAGAVSAFTVILMLPTRGFLNTETIGPGFLLRALVCGVVARMESLPIALATGIGVGILEQELLWNYPQSGFVELVLFGVVLLTLLMQRRRGGREEEKGTWAAVQPWPPLPDHLRAVWTIRNLGAIVGCLALVIALALTTVMTNSAAITFALIFAAGLVGLSVGIITGLAGQISLGQFALGGVGALASYQIIHQTGNFIAGFVGAGLGAAGVSVLIGIPALRIRGLMLAVTTLSFSLAVSYWFLQQRWAFGDGVEPGRPIIGTSALDTGKKYYFFALAVLLIGFWLARNVWRSGLGRRLIAIRDNEDAARAFTVHSTRVKLQAFGLAGLLAGLGGALFAHALALVEGRNFPPSASINVVALAAIGGIGTLSGPLIGALYIIGIPALIPLDSAALAASAFGWLLLILYFPGGVAQIIAPARMQLIAWLGRRAGVDQIASDTAGMSFAATAELRLVSRAGSPPRLDRTLLEVRGVSKRFSGVVAVDDVTIGVREGETLGLIGPNGAGKTTLFELISGFTKPDTGAILFEGADVTSASPEERGRAGLIRSFQDAHLFPTMTILDTLQLAYERKHPTRFAPAIAGSRRAERQKEARARELISLLGLQPWTHKYIGELSTGTRRITELACLLALEPTLLLLDEPSSGIAQRETEALGDLLRKVKHHLSTTLVIIEHDMPLVMGLSDRIIAMESGAVIACGPPEAVRNDPAVVEAYLGGDISTIQRSGLLAAVEADRCTAETGGGSRCSRRASTEGRCAQHLRAPQRAGR